MDSAPLAAHGPSSTRRGLPPLLAGHTTPVIPATVSASILHTDTYTPAHARHVLPWSAKMRFYWRRRIFG